MMVACLALASCSRAPKSNEAIRQAVIDHLANKTGLDVKAMNVDVTSVQYRGKEADAVINFAPKNMPGSGMAMNYTLEAQGDKWVVKKKAGGAMGAAHPGAEAPGSGAMGGAEGKMPPGHPPIGAAEGGSSPMGSLPPLHPPMAGDANPSPAKPADPAAPSKK